MTTESKPTGRRPRRPRNRPATSRNSSRSFREDRPSTPTAPAPKKSFWEKIVSFFAGAPEAKPVRSTSASQTSSRPERPKRQESASAEPKRERRERPPIRRPEAVEVTTPRIYVGNLSFDASESDLFELFNGVGLVQNVEVVSNKHTMRSKGFAFVQMQTVAEAQRAVAELHDKEYMGRKLVVSGAKADDRRPERDRSESATSEVEESAPEVEETEACAEVSNEAESGPPSEESADDAAPRA